MCKGLETLQFIFLGTCTGRAVLMNRIRDLQKTRLDWPEEWSLNPNPFVAEKECGSSAPRIAYTLFWSTFGSPKSSKTMQLWHFILHRFSQVNGQYVSPAKVYNNHKPLKD
jgi:hypothetical protein